MFSSAIQYIARKERVSHITHYLDDFLIVNSKSEHCKEDLDKFISICNDIHIPLAKDKTMGPTQVINFLGYEIDTLSEVIRLPQEKLDKCMSIIRNLLNRNKCTLRDLQSLLGLLNFACAVIVPGRAFLQRLYWLTIGIKKPHFFIRLTIQAKKDLEIWMQFLQNYNGITLYKEELFLSEHVLHIFTDASQSLGCGAVFNKHWFSLAWPSNWWSHQNITFLELVPIVLALETWSHELSNNNLIIHTDNMALVYIINSQSSKEILVMHFIRRLVLKALTSNINVKAIHVQGSKNKLSDYLSRLQVDRFKMLHPIADVEPSQVQPLPLSLDCKNNL